MKKIFLALVLILGTITSQAQSDKTVAKFKVNGNCEMCKVRIEKAANSVDGVFKANWNIGSKIIKVVYDSTTTNLTAIHESISNMGYKTETLAAKQEGYNALPSCCKVKGALEAPKKE